MSFLHGVLESVKDDDNVTTYDNNDASNNITSVIDTLNTSVGKGREAFGDAVTEVDKATGAVKSKLGEFVTDKIGMHIKSVAGEGVKKLQDQLGNWTKVVKDIQTNVHTIETLHINNLDKTLRNDIMHNFEPVSTAVRLLLDSAENATLSQQMSHVDAELVAQEKRLEKTITYESSELERKLNEEYETIRQQISTMSTKRQQGIKAIRGAIDSVKVHLGVFDAEYKEKIRHKFLSLKDEMTEIIKNTESKKCPLELQVDKIRSELLEVGGTLQVQVGKLEKWMKDVKTLINHAKTNQLNKIAELETGRDSRHAITETALALEKWKDTLQHHINNVKDELKEKVMNVKTEVDGLEDKLKEDLGKLRGGIKTAVTGYVKGYVSKVKEQVEVIKGKSEDQGLRGFVKHVTEKYAEEFLQGKKGFGNLVQQWINDILENDMFVQNCLDGYFMGSKNHVTFQPPYNDWTIQTDYKGKTNGIAEAIKNALGKDGTIKITNAQIVPDSSTNKIQYHVNAAYTCVNDFATSLERKLKEGKIRTTNDDLLITNIASAIEGALEMTQESAAGKTSKSYLQAAVKPILSALLSTAKQVAEQLKSLIGTGGAEAGKVDYAFGTATSLFGELEQALGSTAGTYTTDNSVTIKENIHEKLSGKVDEQFKKTPSGVVGDASGITVETTLEAYTGYKKGNVDTSIQAIKTYADSGFDVDRTKTELGNWSTRITHHLHKLTNEFSLVGQYIHRYFYDLEKEYIDVQLTDIRASIGMLQYTELSSQESGRIQGAIDAALATVNRLEDLPGAVDKARDETDQIMEHLIKELNDRVGDVEVNIKEANDSLRVAIGNVYSTVYSAKEMLDEAIKTLNRNIRNAANEAFEEVRRQIQALFARQKIADLEALRTLVMRQSDRIMRLIDEDARTRIKGLFKTLNGINVTVAAKTIPKFDDRQPNLLEPLKTEASSKNFKGLSQSFQAYLDNILPYIEDHAKKPSQPRRMTVGKASETEESKKVSALQITLDTLLHFLEHSNRYDLRFQNNLGNVKDALSRLISPTFSGYQNAILLDTVKNGVTSLLGELDKVYMNTYDGALSVDWTHDIVNSERCAKVFFSILSTLREELEMLIDECSADWKTHTLCETNGDKDNPLGQFLKRSGYTVAKKQDSKEGELKFPLTNYKGQKIYDNLQRTINDAKKNSHLTACKPNEKGENFNVSDILSCIIKHLNQYNNVCHLNHIDSPKSPTTVNQMLQWCAGLRYHRVYEPLKQHLNSLFANDHSDFSYKIHTLAEFDLEVLCNYSHKLLTSILGTGDEHTVYASDYQNNALNFYYPSTPSQCLDMLLDILRRFLPTLRFLQNQCQLRAIHHGWYDCKYGKDIAPAKLPCDNHSHSKPTCQPSDQPNTQPNCQPTSPLMSYLNDCLPGHLPHQLSSIGCRATCNTCPQSKPGQPCLTPLGFRGFSGSTRTGKELRELIKKFFSICILPPLFCIAPKPPSTLPEHICFAMQHFGGWQTGSSRNKNDLQSAFEKSMKQSSIYQVNDANELCDALRNIYGSKGTNEESKTSHQDGKHEDLLSLCLHKHMTVCSGNDFSCAPYIASLYLDSYNYAAGRNANLYLSWAIYLPWTFWQLLSNLYEAFCNINCQDWGCRSCLRGDNCKRGKHGLTDEKSACDCSSIVNCRGVSPILYRYGLRFGAAWKINDVKSVKQCSDFCKQLKKVLDSKYFKDLFRECDNFLCIIRWPFMSLLLALWSLSLLYLLHIAVVRLDVLRIRSHLRSPASHRIAAQSLLAAARVKALNNVKYFSP
ncbi:hypothetical protein, conserved [Babesia ovata]|uniref:C3H1-type domain-containing protein n=1 Tax=Babesia ovata TaxID=189622 RepID=A0A2H6KJG3_9APIC|nr:uncharacterized protein BOVATA_046200 [Babesia ovata]GBE63127.1 hypothetical protein, conserved [Babesia ovata]